MDRERIVTAAGKLAIVHSSIILFPRHSQHSFALAVNNPSPALAPHHTMSSPATTRPMGLEMSSRVTAALAKGAGEVGYGGDEWEPLRVAAGSTGERTSLGIHPYRRHWLPPPQPTPHSHPAFAQPLVETDVGLTGWFTSSGWVVGMVRSGRRRHRQELMEDILETLTYHSSHPS